MTTGIRKRLSACATLMLICAVHQQAGAWDAAKAGTTKTHLLPTPQRPFPFQTRFSGYHSDPNTGWPTRFGQSGADAPDGFFPQGSYKAFLQRHSATGGFTFDTRYIHEAHGGRVVAGEPAYAQTIYFCPNRPTGTDFAAQGCRIADRFDRSPGWATSRVQWVDGDATEIHDEHVVLARRAAQLAGLPSVLGDPFWLRYAAPNGYISSRVNNSVGESGWIVAPRWLPQDPTNSGSSSTLRAVSLYQLAETPDFALSLWDWAAAQELCPLDISAPGFPPVSDDPGNNRCHDYLHTIGPLNMTHFAPANRSVYEYYHNLALGRMAECHALATLRPYSEFDGAWANVSSPHDTEAHACEREALVYEMFAQHFIQDAWSSGHMWHRWGYAEPALFPSRLNEEHGLNWDSTQNDIPLENEKGRRLFIAGMAAAFTGMVHGTKAMTMKKALQYPFLGQAIVAARLTDDPLCAPRYTSADGNSLDVLWRNDQELIARGIGDMFLQHVLPDGDPELSEEADRLAMCTAMSLREVYDAGPKAHGEAGTFGGRWPMSSFDFDSECWSQRATNDSMIGAVSPLPIALSWDNNSVAKSVFSFVNDLVINEYAKGNSNNGAPDPNWAMPNDADRAKFMNRLKSRMIMDQMSVVEAYLDNGKTDGVRDMFGTKSARGQRKRVYMGQTEIKFLGVPPARPLNNTPPVSFMDVQEPFAVPDEGAPSQMLRRLFARAHPEDTCEVPGLINRLRDQCIAGAEQPGGDPEACTRCAQVAELQMPVCGLWGYDINFMPSKCTELGYENLGGLDRRFYAHPLDPAPNCIDTLTSNVPPYFGAFHYCTGTNPISYLPSNGAGEDAQLVGEKLLSRQVLETVDCSEVPEFDGPYALRDVTSARYRIAIGMSENTVESSSWLPPVVTALVEERTDHVIDKTHFCLGTDPNAEVLRRTSSDLKLQALIDPLPLWDNEAAGYRAFGVDNWFPDIHPIHFEVCGITQRATYANRTCSELLPLVVEPQYLNAVGLPQLVNGFEANTATSSSESRCSVIEPRVIKSTCFEGACNANGLCTSAAAPDIVFAR